MTVWKFLVKASGASIKGVPLHIGLDPQTREPAIWCLCDPNDKDEQLRPMPYVVVMTGEPIPEEAGQYVTTVTGIAGWIVAHFFHQKKNSARVWLCQVAGDADERMDREHTK